MKKITALLTFTLVALLSLSGCKATGDDFLGRWDRVEKKFPGKDDLIEISRNDGVFHITRKRWSPFHGAGGDYLIEKVQAHAESNSVISIINGGLLAESTTFSLEDGSLLTNRGVEYKRIK